MEGNPVKGSRDYEPPLFRSRREDIKAKESQGKLSPNKNARLFRTGRLNQHTGKSVFNVFPDLTFQHPQYECQKHKETHHPTAETLTLQLMRITDKDKE